MGEIRFYHLTTKSPRTALPELLEKAYARQQKVVVQCEDAHIAEMLNDQLWLYDDQSFLPHGTAKDGDPALMPIFITADDHHPKADILMLFDGAVSSRLGAYAVNCILFDGKNETRLTWARALWADLKAKGHELTYYQQQPTGGWEQKA